MANNNENNIIIKKVKKSGDAHHGGAWKVAYADFVTAMMAFFLLLWLISSTSESQKEGIAEYFTPTIGLRDSQGIGFQGGESPTRDGTKKDDLTPIGIIPGSVPPGQTRDPDKKALIEADQEAQLFEQAREEIKQAFESDPSLRDYKDNIIVEQSPEGLKIEIADSDKHPMFQSGSAALTEHGRLVVGKLGEIIEKMPNFISITGHTDADPLNAQGGRFTNWELSAERANSARRQLSQGGMETGRVGKVVGMADMELKYPNEPRSAKNRRITIILLRGSHFKVPQYINRPAGSILSVPDVDETILKRKEEPEAPITPVDKRQRIMRPLDELGNGSSPLPGQTR